MSPSPALTRVNNIVAATLGEDLRFAFLSLGQGRDLADDGVPEVFRKLVSQCTQRRESTIQLSEVGTLVSMMQVPIPGKHRG